MNKDGVPVGRESEHPAVGANWEDAQAFCAWLTAKEQAEGRLPKDLSYRLPSDHEWSCAAGIGEKEDPAKTPSQKNGQVDLYPWDAGWPPPAQAGNYADESFHAKFPLKRNVQTNRDENLWVEGYTDGFATLAPVGSFPANAYGLHELGGNLWEFCGDWWNQEQKELVARGAAWNIGEGLILRSSYRARPTSTQRGFTFGFRVVLAPVP